MNGLLHSCDTSRTQPEGTNGRKVMQPRLTGVSCLFLPMSAYASVQNGFDVGTGWTVDFDDGTDIQVGDKLTFNSIDYMVRGVKAFTGIPAVSHLEIAAVMENAHE